jgi:hypothetical protein
MPSNQERSSGKLPHANDVSRGRGEERVSSSFSDLLGCGSVVGPEINLSENPARPRPI